MNKLLEKIEKMKYGKLFVQFVKFGLVGVTNTLISLIATYVVYFFFKLVFGIDTTWSLDVSTTIGYVVGVLNSYFWNSKYVFKDKKEQNSKKTLVKSFVCYGATYLLSMFMMNFMVDVLHIPPVIAPIPRLIITIPLNFIANKLWAYKDKT